MEPAGLRCLNWNSSSQGHRKPQMRQLEAQCEEGLRDKAGGNVSLSGILRPYQTDQTTQVMSFDHCSFLAHSLGEKPGSTTSSGCSAECSASGTGMCSIAVQGEIVLRGHDTLCSVSASGSEEVGQSPRQKSGSCCSRPADGANENQRDSETSLDASQ